MNFFFIVLLIRVKDPTFENPSFMGLLFVFLLPFFCPPFSLKVQLVFTACRPTQGVLERVRTCAPALQSVSGHVIIRMPYHFLGSHPSFPLCFSLLISVYLLSLSTPVLTFFPVLAAHVCVWACVWVWCTACPLCLNSEVRLWSCTLFALFCWTISLPEDLAML